MSNSKCCYIFRSSVIAEAIMERNSRRSVYHAVHSLLQQDSSRPDGLLLALLTTNDGLNAFAVEISRLLDLSEERVAGVLRDHLESAILSDFQLTGAEAITFILQRVGVTTAFVYPGTSELALCDCLMRIPGIHLVNGRGDKECAFMAAGASLLKPNLGIAILHGARGLTSAAGAIADSRRNEVATVFVVGLPSTTSARFLPPHGENGLMQGIGNFVKWWHEVRPASSGGTDCNHAARGFVNAFLTALCQARTRPYGPTMFGIPQDLAESEWIPWSTLAMGEPLRCAANIPKRKIMLAAQLVARHQRVLILIDDYLLKYEDAKPTLAEFSALSGAPVLQVRYRRGAMLFERLTKKDVPNFVGWLDPAKPNHRDLLAAADILVTLEDRNLYRRVIGDLPNRQKIAITSDASKVIKNEYITHSDLILEGDVVEILRTLNGELSRRGRIGGRRRYWANSIEVERPRHALKVTTLVQMLCSGIVQSLADAMRKFDTPVLVDDSQMFGGMVSEHYDELPSHLRIFGDHGGFVGSGIAYATGLAIANPLIRVFCLLGDQGFTNAFQGLVAASQEKARVVFLICNNGESVSLIKQSWASLAGCSLGDDYSYLENPENFDYSSVAAALGVASWCVDCSLDQGASGVKQAISLLRDHLTRALAVGGPSLIELYLPGRGELWQGIWQTVGYDEFTTARLKA